LIAFTEFMLSSLISYIIVHFHTTCDCDRRTDRHGRRIDLHRIHVSYT